MALDGAFLHKLKCEIEEKALGARVDKLYQPSREELVLNLRGHGFTGKLLLSARGSAPRIHFTEYAPENPATPPMLCMLLRKYLVGAKLVALRQYGLDRVLELEFDAISELGDRIRPRLVLEIMGGRSNIIFIGADGRIVDAVRRTDLESNATRILQPGVSYTPPENQGKLNITECNPEQILARLRDFEDMPLCTALSKTLDGASAIVCRELAYRACRSTDIRLCEMDTQAFERLQIHLARLAQEITAGGAPTLIADPAGQPIDFCYLPVEHYGTAAIVKAFPDYSALLDSYYAERERDARIKRKGADLLKLLSTLTARISRKLDAQRGDLARCADREKYRIFGELLKANLHAIPRGASAAVVQNYYDPELKEVKIPLNAALSPASNAQRYFKEYKKSYTAEQTLTRLIAEGEQELRYLDSVFDALSRASSDAELGEIREELESGGYIRSAQRGKSRKPTAGKPMTFRSTDGYTITVGRNNRQNDQLTMKTADRDDLWLHVKNIPGSHVILSCANQPISDTALHEAAMLAAYYSKASDSASVPVDYVRVRQVKKPNGAKPGMVIYETNRTIYVTPDRETVEKLKA